MTFDCKNYLSKCQAECCSCFVPIPRWLYEVEKDKISKKVVDVMPFAGDTVLLATEDERCVFLGENKQCSIYETRPEVCRKFGTCEDEHPMLVCPYQTKEGGERSESI